MSSIAIPTGAADLTAAWLTDAIGDAFGGATVTEAIGKQIGTGQIADSVRLELRWHPSEAGPTSLVTKVTSGAEESKRTAMATRTYEVEVGFYSDLASALPVRTPTCYWAGHDQATGAYAVVLEDVAPAVQGDQMAGCSVDEAAAALAEQALLHGPRWGDTSLRGLPWLGGREGSGNGASGAMGAFVPGFLDRYAPRLSPDVVELIQRFVGVARGYGQGWNGPRTIVHRDFRNDNLMFGGERVCVLDWQTVGLGAALSDVSYFLGGSLLPDDRQANEDALVREYHGQLVAQGVDRSWDDCWTDYRTFAFDGLIMAVFASMLVTRTDRGDEMFIAMADRAGRHALDLEAEALIAR